MEVFFKNHELTIKIAGAIIVSAAALFQWYQSIYSKNIERLIDVWRKFYETKEFYEVFSILNTKDDQQINTISIPHKLKFLALLEEVAILNETFRFSHKNPTYSMFMWHFHYVYDNKVTRVPFWSGIGEDKEMKSASWKKQRHFMEKCRDLIKLSDYKE